MAATYEPIATNTLGSATLNVTFSSIPSTYTDLILICVTKQSTIGQITLRLNGLSSGYSDTNLYGTGSTVGTNRDTAVDAIYFSNSANSTSIFTTSIIHINNYTNTNMYKPILGRTGTSSTDVTLTGGLVQTYSAITSTTLRSSGSSFTAGSTFTLYGIKAA